MWLTSHVPHLEPVRHARGDLDGLVHHSDHGVLLESKGCRNTLQGMRCDEEPTAWSIGPRAAPLLPLGYRAPGGF